MSQTDQQEKGTKTNKMASFSREDHLQFLRLAQEGLPASEIANKMPKFTVKQIFGHAKHSKIVLLKEQHAAMFSTQAQLSKEQSKMIVQQSELIADQSKLLATMHDSNNKTLQSMTSKRVSGEKRKLSENTTETEVEQPAQQRQRCIAGFSVDTKMAFEDVLCALSRHFNPSQGSAATPQPRENNYNTTEVVTATANSMEKSNGEVENITVNEASNAGSVPDTDTPTQPKHRHLVKIEGEEPCHIFLDYPTSLTHLKNLVSSEFEIPIDTLGKVYIAGGFIRNDKKLNEVIREDDEISVKKFNE